MANSGVDKGRRRVLVAATSVVGAAGVAAVAAPFLSSWNPSARALAAGAPVEIAVTKAEPGQQIRVIWRGKPVWLVNRTPEMLAALEGLAEALKDPNSENVKQQPEYAKNLARTREGKEKFLVLVGICTHLGCSPTYRPEVAPADLGPDWKGGWYCPCHGSRFDLAGRVFKNVPAGANLEVPPYYFKDDNTIVVGENGGTA
ncbi:MAG: ubiquinol-cytochrome c reductase iron-sulfur subunit [Thiothrix lacustris]|uniref:Ubiquinol-cytochrome c reductase iron-sulfur subunit n=1 Tax=Thiothrix lacustris TaxID=525917 RepID=A0A1Y1QP69_9GAMM|nr:MAG: ubiquinol-cytochrome c reductase iron-sulfur subunit [Thiothrix lacustris]